VKHLLPARMRYIIKVSVLSLFSSLIKVAFGRCYLLIRNNIKKMYILFLCVAARAF